MNLNILNKGIVPNARNNSTLKEQLDKMEIDNQHHFVANIMNSMESRKNSRVSLYGGSQSGKLICFQGSNLGINN